MRSIRPISPIAYLSLTLIGFVPWALASNDTEHQKNRLRSVVPSSRKSAARELAQAHEALRKYSMSLHSINVEYEMRIDGGEPARYLLVMKGPRIFFEKRTLHESFEKVLEIANVTEDQYVVVTKRRERDEQISIRDLTEMSFFFDEQPLSLGGIYYRTFKGKRPTKLHEVIRPSGGCAVERVIVSGQMMLKVRTPFRGGVAYEYVLNPKREYLPYRIATLVQPEGSESATLFYTWQVTRYGQCFDTKTNRLRWLIRRARRDFAEDDQGPPLYYEVTRASVNVPVDQTKFDYITP